MECLIKAEKYKNVTGEKLLETINRKRAIPQQIELQLLRKKTLKVVTPANNTK
jgi:hypothetical protein